MLHWLAGQKGAEGSNDPDTTGYVEPPETPAPVFAVRAFKHAIFGTPQTNHSKPRRHSNTENARPKNIETKPSRPSMNRPKSTNDAHTLAKQEPDSSEEPVGSPTKGILLTPGAAAARKKNVTFGENVVDNEEKRPMKSGLPDDCPGKFPSPWANISNDKKRREGSPDKGRSRSKLTEALEQVRDDSKKRKSKGDGQKQTLEEEDIELEDDHNEPKSADGKYWKREYDIYRTNTQREVKKLITKQKAAKSFAQMKDSQCTELADQLRQEQKKVEKLEAKTGELASLVRDLQAQLHVSRELDMKQPDSGALSTRAAGEVNVSKGDRSNSLVSSAPANSGWRSKVSHTQEKAQERKPELQAEAEGALLPDRNLQEDSLQRPSEPYVASAVPENRKSSARSVRGRSKSYQEDVQLKSTDDIWAQLDSSSNPVIAQAAVRPRSANSGLAVTSGTEATPLKALNINTLATGLHARRGGSPQSMDVECKSTPDLERVDSKNSTGEPDQRHDSPVFSSALPQPSPELVSSVAPTRSHQSSRRQDGGARIDYGASQVLESSPFQHLAKDLPPLPPDSTAQPPVPPHKTPISNNTKENIAPNAKSYAQQDDSQAKPSALWSSMNAALVGKRHTSVTGKDGKELSDDRIAAARARIAARGRVAS